MTVEHGERQIFHFKGNLIVVARHADNREKLLPPLGIVSRADGNIVPRAAGKCVDRLGIQHAVRLPVAALRP